MWYASHLQALAILYKIRAIKDWVAVVVVVVVLVAVVVAAAAAVLVNDRAHPALHARTLHSGSKCSVTYAKPPTTSPIQCEYEFVEQQDGP